MRTGDEGGRGIKKEIIFGEMRRGYGADSRLRSVGCRNKKM